MKKQPSFLTLAAVFTACSLIFPSCKNDDNETPSLPTAGLVAYYPFDGNAQDESEYVNHGTPTSVEYVRNRKNQESKAVYFNGTNAYVLVPHIDAINFGDQNYAISCWVKYGDQVNTVSQDNHVLAKSYTNTNYPFTLRVYTQNSSNPGKWQSPRKDDGSCNNGTSTTNGPSTATGSLRSDDDTWHHFLILRKGKTLTAYMDGAVVSTMEDKTTCSTQNADNLCIGVQKPGFDRTWYTGALDDLRIYNRALSEAEIKLLYEE